MPSSFFGLPPEIRTMIYKLIYVKDTPIWSELDHHCEVPHQNALIGRVFREEALTIYYSWNTFRITYLQQWDFLAQQAFSRLVRRVQLEISPCMIAWIQEFNDKLHSRLPGRKRLTAVFYDIKHSWQLDATFLVTYLKVFIEALSVDEVVMEGSWHHDCHEIATRALEEPIHLQWRERVMEWLSEIVSNTGV